MHSALLAYASEHYGNFPDSNKGSYDALQKLYPEFSAAGIELAGISGDTEAVVAALSRQTSLNQSLTSWVYLQGFKNDDDPNIAILWESRGGLYPNGRRNFFGGHAVLFIGGVITNIPAADWENFMKQQEKLRSAAQAHRRK